MKVSYNNRGSTCRSTEDCVTSQRAFDNFLHGSRSFKIENKYIHVHSGNLRRGVFHYYFVLLKKFSWIAKYNSSFFFQSEYCKIYFVEIQGDRMAQGGLWEVF